jgi:hypothetical protein
MIRVFLLSLAIVLFGAPATAQCVLTAPTANQYLSPDVTFTWTATADATRYYLYVGTTLGAKDVIDTGEITTRSYTRAGLPTDVTLYARIWTLMPSGLWVAGPDVTFRCYQPLAITVDASMRQPMTWAGTQEVLGYIRGVPYPLYPLVANPGISSTSLPFTVPQGCWLGIEYVFISGKFGNHDRPGYLVLDGIGAVSEGGVALVPAHPILIPPGGGIAPYFINNTEKESEYMTGIVQGTLLCGIDPRARMSDVLAAFATP